MLDLPGTSVISGGATGENQKECNLLKIFYFFTASNFTTPSPGGIEFNHGTDTSFSG
jgi:hypothetical protein